MPGETETLSSPVAEVWAEKYSKLPTWDHVLGHVCRFTQFPLKSQTPNGRYQSTTAGVTWSIHIFSPHVGEIKISEPKGVSELSSPALFLAKEH